MFSKREAYVVNVHGEQVASRHGKDYSESHYVELGSITKTITATAIRWAVHHHDLEYGTPIRDLLEVDLPDAITVATLTDHTSGLPRVHEGMTTSLTKDPYADVTREYFDTRIIPELKAPRPEYIGQEAYSNLGYALLGRILEQVTGEHWIDLVRREIGGPRGIELTASPEPGHRTLIDDFGGKKREPWALSESAYLPAGGLWSTLHDLATFGLSVLGENEAGLPHSGWMQKEGTFWHNGQTRDSGSCLVIDPARDLVVATHTIARLPFAADRLASRLVKKYTQKVPA